MKLFWSFMLKAVAVVLTTLLLPGVTLSGWSPVVWLVIVLVPIDYVIKPILHILSLPISIVTLGLFALVINGAMILLASYFVSGFEVSGLVTAIIFSVILGFVTTILQKIFASSRE